MASKRRSWVSVVISARLEGTPSTGASKRCSFRLAAASIYQTIQFRLQGRAISSFCSSSLGAPNLTPPSGVTRRPATSLAGASPKPDYSESLDADAQVVCQADL